MVTTRSSITIPRIVWWILAFVLLFVLIVIVHALGGFEIHFSWLHIGIK